MELEFATVDWQLYPPAPVSVEDAVRTIALHPGMELEFATVGPHASVHVLRPWLEDGAAGKLDDEYRTQGLWVPNGILSWSLCGIRFSISSNGAGYRVGQFDDLRLCQTCHRLLGPESHRAFEHDLEVSL